MTTNYKKKKILERKIIREFTRMQLLGPSMPCLPRMYDFWIFPYQLGEFILPTSIQLLAPDAS